MDQSHPGFIVEPVDAEQLLDQHQSLFQGMEHVVGGYFPNSFRIMGRNPEILRACMQLGAVVMRQPGQIGIPLKWLIGHMVSAASGCRYCTAHTIEHAAEVALTPEQVETMWTFESSEHFSEAQRATMRFAFAAGQSPNATSPELVDGLRRHYNDDQIVEIVAVIAYWGFWNRWNDTCATPLESEPIEFAHKHLTAIDWTPGRHQQI